MLAITNAIGYVRVSTATQGRSGLGLEAQQASVKDYLQRVGGVELASFVEVESGRKADRPKLQCRISCDWTHLIS